MEDVSSAGRREEASESPTTEPETQGLSKEDSARLQHPNPHLRPMNLHPLKPPQILTPKKSPSDPIPHLSLDQGADS
jgi:hypothetical protein